MASAVETEALDRLFSSETSAAEKELQKAKYAELVEMLLSAGYFRARIATLSPFDKVRAHPPRVPAAHLTARGARTWGARAAPASDHWRFVLVHHGERRGGGCAVPV